MSKQPKPEQWTLTVWPSAVIATTVTLPPSPPLPTPHVTPPKGGKDG
jgi:hypothetical protein